MRVVRLDLKRFGRFTDRTLDLSAGEFGLHLVYGPNEAGKSTALRALHQFFYGIETRTSDDFLHPYTSLRIGAVLSKSDGETLECIRRKGNRNTLRAADDETVVDDRQLAAWLEGVDEETFRRRYGIDYEQLVAGGREIVAGHGDLGQSLFAAGAGVANLRGVQQRLEAEAGDLFKPSGKNPHINALLRDLKSARDRLRQLRLSTSDWKKHDTEFRKAQKADAEVRRRLGELQAESDQLKRLRDAVPHAASLERLQSELTPLADTPILPHDFSERRAGAASRLTSAQAEAERARKELEKVEQSLSQLDVPDDVLRHATEITHCFEEGGAVRKAGRDLIERRAELAKEEAAIRQLLAELGAAQLPLQDVESLRLPKAQCVWIQKLGNTGNLLETRAEQARRELARLDAQFETANRRLKELGPAVEVGPLATAVRQAERDVEREEEIRQLESQAAALGDDAALQLETLGLYQGDLDAVRRLAAPDPETCDHWEAELQQAESTAAGLRKELAQTRGRLEELERELEDLRLAHDVPTEDDLADARRRRDEGWRLVRATWLGPGVDADALREYTGTTQPNELAEAFARDMTTADETADRLRREAHHVAKKQQLLSDQGMVSQRVEALQAALSEAESEERSRRGRWRQVWLPLEIEALSPREMRAWLDRHRKLCQTIDQWRRMQADVAARAKRASDGRRRLLDVLLDLGVESASNDDEATSLDGLLAFAQTHQAQLESVNRSRETLRAEFERLAAELVELRRIAGEDEAKLVDWKRDWAEAMKLLGLAPNADPSEANTILDLRRDVLSHEEKAGSLRERIAGMVAEAERFAERVRMLAREAGPALEESDAHRAVEALAARLSQARQDEVRRTEQSENQRSLQSQLAEADLEIEKQHATLAAFCKEAGCQSPDELPQVEQRSRQRREKEGDRRAVLQQLEGLAAGTPLEEFLSEVRRRDFDEISLRIRQLDDELQDLEQQGAALNRTIGGEENELARMNGAGDAAEAEEEAQSLLAEIRSKCEEYARLKLAAAVLAESIERYRERHQGPILEKAGELFAELTLGSFHGLRADFFDSEKPELVGVRPGGDAVRVSGMSEGTCDQLYLSLRLASLEHELEHRQPLPLIVDDILIMFDDDRSAAALKALARLSEKTQVILFTHHEHLVQLARQTLDDDVLFVQPLESEAAETTTAS
ncbi:MAG: AAA family ATPase [Pirellulaceae bacterium]